MGATMRFNWKKLICCIFPLLPVLLPLPALAQEAGRQLGTVNFQAACNETAQRRFDRAMRYQHSFWYRQAKEVFEEALNADPSCAIAHWGIALSLLNKPPR